MQNIVNKLLAFSLIILAFAFHENVSAQKSSKYYIGFTDKNNSPYSVNAPEKFLSQRSIEKRRKFGIAITEEDFPVNQNYIDSILKTDKSNLLLTKSKWLNGITIYSEDTALENKINGISFVDFIEKTVMIDSLEVFKVDSNRKYIDLKSPDRYDKTPQIADYHYGKGKGQIRVNNVHWLHRLGYTGRGMVMMVMDAGFHNVDTIKHFRKLREEGRLLGVKNFVLPDENLFRSGSHGTMVLSCIAAQLEGELVGSSPDVSVYLAKTEDGRSEHKIEEDNWSAGVEWADSLGVDVLNSSLGYTKFDDSLVHPRHYADLNGLVSRASRTATIASRKGLIICNSAGNEGSKPWHHIGAPADAEGILTVGATFLNREKTPFSSFGPTADGRVKPDACAVGGYTQVANPKGKTTIASGTSFSSPLLSGMVASLWQAFPQKNNTEIMDAIRRSGSQYNAPDSALGYGITDFLRAYNILYSADTTQTFYFNSFVANKENKYKISFTFNSKEKQTIEVKVKSRKSNTEKTFIKKVKPKITTISIPFSKITDDWDIADIKITLGGITRNYVAGIETTK